MAWFVRRVALISYPILEILLLWWVAGLIGWGWVVLLLLAGFLVGVLLIRAAGKDVLAALSGLRGRVFTQVDEASGATTRMYAPSGDSPDPAEQARVVRSSGYLVTAGLLFMVPGFLTDVAGALLALPPTRSWLSRRASRHGGAVIQGETVVVDESGTHVAHWGSAAPGEPRIISGEIMPPGPRTMPPNE